MKKFILLKSVVDFFRDGGLMLAGSISYFSMMAIVPFCLLLVAIFGHVLGENEKLVDFFTERLINLFPQITYEITNELKKLISYKSIGLFTLVLYGLFSLQLFSSLEIAVNTIFKTKIKRHPLISILLSLLIITLILTFIMASFGAATAFTLLEALRKIAPELRIGKITGFLIAFVVPLILVFLTAIALYILLPVKKVRLKHAVQGAIFTAVLLEAAKYFFTFYVVEVAKFGAIYGSLSAFVIFLLWIFYSSCIFLIGAEIVHNKGNAGKD